MRTVDRTEELSQTKILFIITLSFLFCMLSVYISGQAFIRTSKNASPIVLRNQLIALIAESKTTVSCYNGGKQASKYMRGIPADQLIEALMTSVCIISMFGYSVLWVFRLGVGGARGSPR